MSTAIARKVVQSFQSFRDIKGGEGKADNEVGSLSGRAQEVLDMLAKGFLYKEIPDKLQPGLGAIRTHIRRIYAKLHVQSRTEAVVKHLGQDVS